MSQTASIAIRCAAGERPVWQLALAGLDEALQGNLSFSAIWLEALDRVDIPAGSDIVCLSMQPDLLDSQPWSSLEARWRGAAMQLHENLVSRGIPVFIVTILGHLPAKDRAWLGNLRRLNLLAARLSQEFGLFVIDIDRVIAHRGTLALAADAWLEGEPARRVAAEAIIDTLLRTGIDHLVDDETLQKALDYHAEVAKSALAKPAVTDFMLLEHSEVKARGQVFVSASNEPKYQSLEELLHDLRARRISVVPFARKVVDKLVVKITHRKRRH